MSLIIRTLVVGPLDVNCYILWDKEEKEAVCIDPGGKGEEILGFIREEGLRLRLIINTHGHFDHVGANGFLKDATGVTIAIHKEDARLLEVTPIQAMTFGIGTVPSPPADLLLTDGDTITFGKHQLKAIHTPGHTKGGICLLISDVGFWILDFKSQISNLKSQILFTGDTLFAGAVGRSDLPGGSYSELMASVKGRLFPLGDDVRVLPGHGPETSIGEERRGNTAISSQ
ncbi:MAG: MBL fold metallo-hydrolase [Deltaproteobacteria bacterium]|nr:MBL fold metallo-hydrolase [Deltaproteobacteria bacterium]